MLKPEQANMDIRHYTLALDVDPQQKTINGYTEIDLILSNESGSLLLDLWNGLTVKQILVNGKQQTFVHQNDLITINASQPWPAGKIKIKFCRWNTRCCSTSTLDRRFQWDKDGQGNPWIAMTCQGEGAKSFSL
jgi:aminopeptidase N